MNNFENKVQMNISSNTTNPCFFLCNLYVQYLTNVWGDLILLSCHRSMHAWPSVQASNIQREVTCFQCHEIIKRVSFWFLFKYRYLTDTDDLDVRPVHVIHYANILTMLYTGFVRNEEAYLIAHSYVICHHILLPISTVCYNFGLSLLCLNWLIYKHNSSSIFFEDFVSVSQQIKTWF